MVHIEMKKGSIPFGIDPEVPPVGVEPDSATSISGQDLGKTESDDYAKFDAICPGKLTRQQWDALPVDILDAVRAMLRPPPGTPLEER